MVTAAGGKIFTGAEVAEIIDRRRQGDRRAARLGRDAHRDEGRHRRRRARRAAGKLLPDGSGDAGFDTAMKKFRHAPGTMMIHLALDGLPDWRAGAELRHSPMSISRPRSTRWRAPISRRSPACCRTSRCWSSASRPRSIRRARRMASMCCGCRCACCPPRFKATRQARSRRRHWDEVKERYADRVMGIIESYAPGLRGKILGRAVFSPLDLERENPESRRRRPDLRQPPFRAEFPVPAGARLCALEHAGRRPASGRRGDLAGRRRRRRIGLHAGAAAWREVTRASRGCMIEQSALTEQARPRSTDNDQQATKRGTNMTLNRRMCSDTAPRRSALAALGLPSDRLGAGERADHRLQRQPALLGPDRPAPRPSTRPSRASTSRSSTCSSPQKPDLSFAPGPAHRMGLERRPEPRS